MKIITAVLLFLGSCANAQDIFVPPTGYQPPPKAEEVLPIAPMRIDDRAEMPAQVFSSVSKSDPWEKYERGEGKNSKSTVMVADSNAKKRVAKSKITSKRKVDSKKKVAKLKSQKGTLSKGKVANAKKISKRQPAGKKASSKGKYKGKSKKKK